LLLALRVQTAAQAVRVFTLVVAALAARIAHVPPLGLVFLVEVGIRPEAA